jgi:hypothetical protein
LIEYLEPAPSRLVRCTTRPRLVTEHSAPLRYTGQVSSRLTPASVPRASRRDARRPAFRRTVAPHPSFACGEIAPILGDLEMPTRDPRSDRSLSSRSDTPPPRCPYCHSTDVTTPPSRLASTYSRCDACGQLWHPDRLPSKMGGRR